LFLMPDIEMTMYISSPVFQYQNQVSLAALSFLS
jgi:hypothetical protein